MMDTISQIVGWAGTFLIVSAYFLVSYKKVDGGSKVYQLMNVVGVVGTGINAFYQHAWPIFALQVIWGIIGLVALINILYAKKDSQLFGNRSEQNSTN